MPARLASLILGALAAVALAGGAAAEPPFEPRPEVKVAAAAPTPSATPAAAPAAAPGVAPKPATPAPAPASDPLLAGSVRLLLGSVGVVALVLIASRVIRRLPMGRFLAGADGPIRIAASAHLGPKVKLCLLEVAGTSILVAVHAQGVEALHAWPPGTAAPAAPRPPTGPDARGSEAPVLAGQLEGLATRLRGNR